MEPAKVLHPTLNILGAANEICQILILSKRTQNAPKVTVSIKNKGSTRHAGQNLFSFKENYLPQLCQIICEIQAKENDSHLALQTVDECNCGLQKTMLLWLKTKTETSTVAVHILSETITEIKVADHISTVLEMRAFMPVSDIIHFSKGILDLLERIKFLNPQVQLTFSLYSLTSVEVDLCNTYSISCENFDIYSGQDLFLGKSTSQFSCQMLKAKSSKSFEIQFHSKDNVTETVYLTCITCLVPICATQKHSITDGDFNCHPNKGQEIHGQVYGPANLPFDMNIVTRKLTLSPDSLLPWQRFGVQVKKSFSCASYDLHCSARVSNKDAVPSWAAKCHRFCMMIAFTLNKKEDSTDDKDTIRRHQEIFKHIEQHVLIKEVYSTFQEAAYTCLTDLLSHNKLETVAAQPRQPGPVFQATHSDLFKKMIPDVASSLTDVFIRSTCVDFRSQVGTLVPTSSRVSMSSYLEKLLWKIAGKPIDISKDATTSDPTADNIEESPLDNWDISQDSLFSAEEDKAMSPDSLDFEWESSASDTLNQIASSYMKPLPDEMRETTCSLDTRQTITHEIESDNFQPIPSLSMPPHFDFDNFLSSENELELWENSGDSLTSELTNICSTKIHTTNLDFPPVKQQDNTDSILFQSGESSEPLPINKPNKIETSKYCKDLTLEHLTDDCTPSIQEYLDKIPRKRFLQYVEDAADVETCLVSESTNACNTETFIDRKKQKFQNADFSSASNVSPSKWLVPLCTEQLDSHVNVGPEFIYFDQAEDTLSDCWFDEEEIANWCTDLDH